MWGTAKTLSRAVEFRLHAASTMTKAPETRYACLALIGVMRHNLAAASALEGAMDVLIEMACGEQEGGEVENDPLLQLTVEYEEDEELQEIIQQTNMDKETLDKFEENLQRFILISRIRSQINNIQDMEEKALQQELSLILAESSTEDLLLMHDNEFILRERRSKLQDLLKYREREKEKLKEERNQKVENLLQTSRPARKFENNVALIITQLTKQKVEPGLYARAFTEALSNGGHINDGGPSFQVDSDQKAIVWTICNNYIRLATEEGTNNTPSEMLVVSVEKLIEGKSLSREEKAEIGKTFEGGVGPIHKGREKRKSPPTANSSGDERSHRQRQQSGQDQQSSYKEDEEQYAHGGRGRGRGYYQGRGRSFRGQGQRGRVRGGRGGKY